MPIFPTLDPKQLSFISDSTIGHYNARSEDFWLGTKEHDVSQNIETLLRHIEAQSPFRILDLGCGPGRDLLDLKKRGHNPTGLDGSKNFVDMAKRISGCTVYHQDFLSLDLPANQFDGIFANATLFHVPHQELPQVLSKLKASLVSGGVLFSSNPRGANDEGWNGERYGCYLNFEQWRLLLTETGFKYLEHYYRPTGLPKEQQPWLASAWRK